MLRITVQNEASGQIVLQILVPQGDASRTLSNMLPLDAARTRPVAKEGEPAQPIAGTLRIEPNPMQQAIAAYIEDLGKRGKAIGSRTQFRTCCLRYARETGTTHPNAITYENVQTWVASHPTWAASTRARALKIISLFTQFCLLVQLIERDPLVGARGHSSVEAPASRAATTEDARAMVSYAAARVLTDKRASARCNRAVYYGCLFLAGCRFDEPRRWRWKDLRLDDEVPHILWKHGANDEERMHKNNRTRALALSPELVEALRIWRDELAAINARNNTLCIAPESRVFPSRPINATWAADRAACGISKLDFRDRGMTAHSARKWLATALTSCGVHEKMVDYLMRHSGRVEYRYYDPPLSEQRAALDKLPRIFPEFFFAANVMDAKRLRTDFKKYSKPPVAKSHEIAEDISVTSTKSLSGVPSQNQLPENAGPDEPDKHGVTTLRCKVPGPAFSGSTLADIRQDFPARDSPVPPSNSGFLIEPPCDETDDIAALLEALARVIRGRSSHAAGRELGGNANAGK